MSPYVNAQYRALREADSITIDPHKAGYAPYPAGALCYRNSAMRDLVSFRAPVIVHAAYEPTVGIYGIEGSKPGAAAAGVWLAHKVIPSTRRGYGKILGQCMWTSKRMYCRLVTMRDERFRITFLQRLPAERDQLGEAEVARQKEYIRENFVDCDNDSLLRFLRHNDSARRLFMQLGSDQVILTYSFNFYDKRGRLNTDSRKANALNGKVFDICSITSPNDNVYRKNLILTSSSFDPNDYGQPFVDHYCGRLGVTPQARLPIRFLISTTMDPWTSDAPDPWVRGGPKGGFLAVVEEALRGAVLQALRELHY